MSILFEPVKMGDLQLSNRIVMSPLTRSRAPGHIPNDMMVKYYEMRADAGLIITEATIIDPMGIGYIDTPGIYSDEQVEGWKKITSAVHAKGGCIVLQLWHVGRISHPDLIDGNTPVAPSAIRPEGHVRLLRPMREYVTPRALELEEIAIVIDQYRHAAANAKKAGFDGVEIHAANGYLIDQFLHDKTNKRNDIYGGNNENRARFLMEVTDAAIEIWGKGRVGIHLSPRMDTHDMGDSDPVSTFTYVAEEFKKRQIAFICTREKPAADSLAPMIKKIFGGAVIANEGLHKDSAEQLITSGVADAVAFGKAFIANPDLVTRLKTGAKLNDPDPDTFYQGGEKGYIDYPTL